MKNINIKVSSKVIFNKEIYTFFFQDKVYKEILIRDSLNLVKSFKDLKEVVTYVFNQIEYFNTLFILLEEKVLFHIINVSDTIEIYYLEDKILILDLNGNCLYKNILYDDLTDFINFIKTTVSLGELEKVSSNLSVISRMTLETNTYRTYDFDSCLNLLESSLKCLPTEFINILNENKFQLNLQYFLSLFKGSYYRNIMTLNLYRCNEDDLIHTVLHEFGHHIHHNLISNLNLKSHFDTFYNKILDLESLCNIKNETSDIKYKDYLLKNTEVFARLFEQFLLDYLELELRSNGFWYYTKKEMDLFSIFLKEVSNVINYKKNNEVLNNEF